MDTDPKANLLKALRTTFITYGYNGASLSRLSDSAGLGKASLYHHFPGGKTEIADVLLRQAVDELQSRVFAATRKKSNPQQRLHTVVDRFVEYTEDGQGHCLLSLFAQEQAPVIHASAVAELLNQWRADLASCFEATGQKPKVAYRSAQAMLNQLYGALLLARISNDPKTLLQAAKRIKTDLIGRS